MGSMQGNVHRWVRLEGLCVFLATLGMYHRFGFEWSVFLLFFLAPDLSMFAYMRGPRFGAAVYNAAHSYVGPVLLLAGAAWLDAALYQPALIWIAGIGFYRAAGFGLKYPDSFEHTHLGPVPFNLPHFLKGLLVKN